MAKKAGVQHRQTEESRRRILEATLELAAERGYEGTTIALVSKRSGLPSGSVYWHFENKDSLFAALIEQSFEEWARQTGWSRESGPRSQQRLDDFLRERLTADDFSHGFWRLGLLLSLERRMADSAARQTFLAIRRRVLDTLAQWWSVLLPDEVGARDPELSRRLAQFTLATSDGLFIAMAAGDDWDFHALSAMLADALSHQVCRALQGADGTAGAGQP
ncbi:TetR/AcrR family transcriptional regulator [Streptomyces sp. NBC_01728]|uniref:TetR/AcrR family transcriptional regulator n=1 Tax=unclassified Streptomyces TaxID=2593676 RepID=UPI0022524F84|nr:MULTISPECIES: TetR/AcrR family transcriptional regulator [unclassified Streptomyces]MCX4457419.1 TetR/AcrR family transcriptional regulator [Streptomyces sp. NBC_01719]MCX4496776.1 TetR/AcrR family transcriptional regulator [Streptomyces sp. NBC_01728]